MKTTTFRRTLAIVEGAIMVALAVILDLLPLPKWPQGGSISVAAVPIIYYAYRRGLMMGSMAGLVWSATQLIIGPWYTPPANTAAAVFLCVLLDYVIAFTVIGTAQLFAGFFGKRKLLGYGVGAAVVCLLRYLSSVLSGVLIWGSYAPEGMNVWWYSLTYNGSYMIPNTALAVVIVTALCAAVDPKTLRPYKREN
jgi:thiamine transporter